MLISPFRMIYELIVFALHAAFIYGLGILFILGMCIWLFSGIEYPEVVESAKTATEFVCLKLEGCVLDMEATTLEEYCTSCVRR